MEGDRIELMAPSLATFHAAIAGEAELAAHLGYAVAPEWSRFAEALPQARDELARDPSAGDWGTRLFVLVEPRTLVGWGGFKGAPDQDGVAELGYSIAPDFEGQGLATDATRILLRRAWEAEDVTAVIAHTLAEPTASARVLEKTGFSLDCETTEGDLAVWRFRIERPTAF